MLLILLCFSQEAKSTHILGGHISYECLGGDEYSFTLSVYSDCFGQQANPVPDNLIFFTPDGSCAGLVMGDSFCVIYTDLRIFLASHTVEVFSYGVANQIRDKN